MDGRGGCCIARYGGGDAAVYDVSKIDQIMLKFRPIAPKPAASGAVSGGSKAAESDNRCVRSGRGRRRRNSNSKENSKSSSSSGEVTNNSGGNKRCRKRKSGFQDGNTEQLSRKSGVLDNTVVTLPLLPETPDLTATVNKGQKKAPVMLSFDGSNSECYSYPAVRESGGDGRVGMWPRQKRVVGSWVIVERVTDTWGEEEPMMLGRKTSDEEKRRVLEEDTCPGFVSDCWNRVWWTNKAYKNMARERGRKGETGTTSFDEEVVVWLVMKEKLPVNCHGFTCRVTVQSTWNQLSSTATVPCDVWKLSDGGFAWRLDVKAALSLGR
ncbi:hypothetical protein V2J09_015048 [Rumex salicifolius]